jgi:hypothetical protein
VSWPGALLGSSSLRLTQTISSPRKQRLSVLMQDTHDGGGGCLAAEKEPQRALRFLTLATDRFAGTLVLR